MTKTEFFKEFNRIARQTKGIDTGTEDGMKKFEEIMKKLDDFRRNFFDNKPKEIRSQLGYSRIGKNNV